MAKRQKPSVSPAELEAKWPALETALNKWVESECMSFDAQVLGSSDAGVFAGMPTIDSKTVMRASHIFQPVIGCELDPKWIRRGGYSTFADLAADLKGRIVNACMTAPIGPARVAVPSKDAQPAQVAMRSRR